jgi:hypothetical protein
VDQRGSDSLPQSGNRVSCGKRVVAGSLTTAELADQVGVSPALINFLMEESARQGVVVAVGENAWAISPDLAPEILAALRTLAESKP